MDLVIPQDEVSRQAIGFLAARHLVDVVAADLESLDAPALGIDRPPEEHDERDDKNDTDSHCGPH